LAEVQEAVQVGLLRNRAFLAVWAAQILSQTAANAVTSALIILVAEITHSNTSSSFLILLAIIPAVLFGIGAGVLVDRTDRRFVLVVTLILMGLTTGLMGLLPTYASAGISSPILLVALRFVQGVASAGVQAAGPAIIADAVPPERRAMKRAVSG